MAKELLTEEDIVYRVKVILEKVRPYIQRDGGDMEFVRYEDSIVYIRMHGACVGCQAIDSTVKDGFEALLLEEVPGVIGVEIVGEEI